MRDDFLPEFGFGSETRAGSHEPAVSENSLIEVSCTYSVHHQLGIITDLLWGEGERETGGGREGRIRGGEVRKKEKGKEQ